MLRSKLPRLLPLGTLMFAVGLTLHNFTHGRYIEFAAGFLIGMSLVFMIAGTLGRSRGALS